MVAWVIPNPISPQHLWQSGELTSALMRTNELALPLPSPTAAFKKIGTGPHLGSTVKLALVERAQMRQPQA